ncbi:uncharacterized protein [Spinacia oleracea]|uniref:SWIM-type domain-containing protein n=1 Tax=Spinacia oleracea TaxID=3562 RepID=A0ABM3RHA7_SPIOL|nr:uncharacterized protein LOC130469623 [Spinacia oleracea]
MNMYEDTSSASRLLALVSQSCSSDVNMDHLISYIVANEVPMLDNEISNNVEENNVDLLEYDHEIEHEDPGPHILTLLIQCTLSMLRTTNFILLWRLAMIINYTRVRANPGTVVLWRKKAAEEQGKEMFKSVFWAFAPSIQAFKHCRPVISVDGTHLYGKYKGTLLVAVAVDGDNKIMPVAFAVVEKESIDDWTWFMACIREKVCPRRKLCVVSDRHIGLKHAMMSDGWAPPDGFHRYCLRHMASNFQNKFKDKHLKNAIHKAALENQICKFNERMDAIGTINEKARQWWESVPLEKWALCHDEGKRYGITTTNLSVSFNNVLKGARSLPITALVQLTFYRLNKYFDERRSSCERMLCDGQNWTGIVNQKLSHNAENANRHHVETFDHQKGIFSVKTGHRSCPGHVYKGGHTHLVNLKEKSCSCQKWQLYGIPCSHVLAACEFRNIDFEPYVKPWYKVSTMEKVYTPKFHPILDKLRIKLR